MDNTNDQAIRLLLQVVGREKVDELVKAMGSLGTAGATAASGVEKVSTKVRAVPAETAKAEAATYELADSYEVLTTDLSATDRAFDKLVADSVEATRTQRLVASALADTGVQAVGAAASVDKVRRSKDDAAKASRALNSRILEFGRAFQDVSQGGLAGGINNIERLVGGAGMAAGVLTVLGTVLFLFKDRIAEAAKASGLFGETMGTAGLLGTLDKVDASLKDTTKELDALKAQQSLTSSEVARYNVLAAKQVELEKEKSAELEKQKQLQALLALKDPTEEANAKTRAKELQAGIGGRQDEVIGGVEASLPSGTIDTLNARRNEALRRLRIAEFRDRQGLAGPNAIDAERARTEVKELNRMLEQVKTRRRDEAQTIVARAVMGGDKDAIDRLVGLADKNPANFAPELRGAFDAGRDAPGKEGREKAAQRQKELDDEERTREGERIEAIAEKQRKEAAARDEDAAKSQAERAKADRGVRADAAAAIGKNTSLDELALDEAIRARATGGEAGLQRGFVQTANALTQDVRRMRPDLSPDQARGVAVGMAGEAAGKARDLTDDGLLRAADMGLRGQQANNYAVNQALAAVQSLLVKQAQATHDAERLGGMAAGLNRNARAMRPPNMGRGPQ